MIVGLLLLYGIWAFFNGTLAYFKKYDLEEFSYRLVITWGFVSILYGVILIFKL